MLSDQKIREIVYNEFAEKSLGTTKQYLEIHEPELENDLPKISRIDRESDGDVIIAYLPVKGEYFSFAVYINKSTKNVFNWGTESGNHVMLRAISQTLTWQEMQAYTILNPDKFWNKGDLTSNKRTVHQFSCIEFIPNPEPDSVENKLNRLLDYIKQDKNGILGLAAHANVYIDVTMDFHYGNQMLGNTFIKRDIIKKIADINLDLNMDYAAWGNPFK